MKGEGKGGRFGRRHVGDGRKSSERSLDHVPSCLLTPMSRKAVQSSSVFMSG